MDGMPFIDTIPLYFNSMKENTQPKFYMVYEGISQEYGCEVSNLISYLVNKQEYLRGYHRLDHDGYFYTEHRVIEEKIGLSEHRQKIAMKKLEEIGILKISSKKRGVLDAPAKLTTLRRFILTTSRRCKLTT